MSEQTKIAWCDSTVNFWQGCTKVSPGCAHCYAEARDKRMLYERISHWGKGAPRFKSQSAVKAAMVMNRKPWICDHCGSFVADKECTHKDCPANLHEHVQQSCHRRRIFSLSLGDWLDEGVPIEWLAEMLDTIRQCDQCVWILCTKRPENFHERMSKALWYAEGLAPSDQGDSEDLPATPLGDWIHEWFSGHDIPQNIIILTSVENQPLADLRIPQLLKIPAACRGLSLEPLLGPLDLERVTDKDHFPGAASCDVLRNRMIHHDDDDKWTIGNGKIDWLIIGGESGRDARPCNVDWVRSLAKQGQDAGVATFVKQLGVKPVQYDMIGDWPEGTQVHRYSTQDNVHFRLKHDKGGDPAEWPVDLRVRQFPSGF